MQNDAVVKLSSTNVTGRNIFTKNPNTGFSLFMIMGYVCSQNYHEFYPSTYESTQDVTDYYLNVVNIIISTAAFSVILLPLMKRLDAKRADLAPTTGSSCCIALKLGCTQLSYTAAGITVAFFKNFWLLTNLVVVGTNAGWANDFAKVAIGLAQFLSIAWFANRLGAVLGYLTEITSTKRLSLSHSPEKQEQKFCENLREFFKTPNKCQYLLAGVKNNANTAVGLILVTGFILATYYPLLIPAAFYNFENHDLDWMKGVHILGSLIACFGMIIPFTRALDDYSVENYELPQVGWARFCNANNANVIASLISAATLAFFGSYFIVAGELIETDGVAAEIAKASIVAATTLWMLWSANRLAAVTNILGGQHAIVSDLTKREPLLAADFLGVGISRDDFDGEPSVRAIHNAQAFSGTDQAEVGEGVERYNLMVDDGDMVDNPRRCLIS